MSTWIIPTWGETPRQVDAGSFVLADTHKKISVHVDSIEQRVSFCGAVYEPWTTEPSFFKGPVRVENYSEQPLTLADVKESVRVANERLFCRALYKLVCAPDSI